ncbi:hypothetical protein GCM10010399_55430 [Dactylosporangium fulvum]|uniref:GntR family transcriptional regulator n=1 Tax=Dactylosporangium fulvum TaxID=53359 RepID=A0ABY5W129_9ACTN|nr:GntR family transcriptional regulator [Dactylosporangium fulvum]UWP83090.1 GntR family transcriptional regulator [Dactylosporangium fulvum]
MEDLLSSLSEADPGPKPRPVIDKGSSPYRRRSILAIMAIWLILIVMPSPTELRVSYHDIAAELRRRIFAHELPPGVSLPSESDLSAAFRCGRQMVREAIGELAREGLVSTARGRPAMVRQSPEWETALLQAGVVVTTRPVTRPEAVQHGWSMGMPVLEVRTAGGEPVLYLADRYGLTTAG